jgi:hypothetical protein
MGVNANQIAGVFSLANVINKAPGFKLGDRVMDAG